jgi:hypothetical protein
MKFSTRMILVAALVCGMTVVQAGIASANKCSAGKVKCVVNKTKALLGCHGKAAGKGLTVDAACIAKAKAKFDGGADPAKGCFEKLEAKGEKAGAKPNVVCPTSDDTAAIEAKVDAFVDDLVTDLDTVVDANKCVAGKIKCATTKNGALLGCYGKAFGKDIALDPTCVGKAESKFDGGATPAKGCFEKLEAKGEKAGAKPSVVCPTSDDTAAIEAKIDAFVADIACDLEPAGCLPATPTPTATPTATATPTPTATFTPNPNCGNGVLDAEEVCDPTSATTTCPNVNNTLFPCNPTTCTCDCPSTVAFSGDPTDPASVLDSGWTGLGHRAPIISDGTVTIALSCSAVGRPCGTCTVSGPIPNTQAGELDDRRCLNDTSVKCTSNADCTGAGNSCQFFFGSNLPLAAGGVGTCVVNQFNGPVSGTANVESGEAVTVANLTSRVYTGPTDNPCPRCLNDPTINDGNAQGTCVDGPRNGLACDANGTVPSRPDFGQTSLDCPPPSGNIAATLPIDLSNSTGTVTKTLSASSPNCSDGSGNKCLCETCNNLAATPCDSNADCVAVGATVCGGRRCSGGTNDGGPCNNVSACPNGGLCGFAPSAEASKPSACLDDTSTAGVFDCADTAPVDGEGECTAGPVTKMCTIASGHGQRACGNDGECGGALGSCAAANRPCFLTGTLAPGLVGTGTLTAQGAVDPPVNDVSNPTLGAVFCIGSTTAGAVNTAAGLPGPGRVTIKGTAVGLP